jgi:SAM-dependent methyltransferase
MPEQWAITKRLLEPWVGPGSVVLELGCGRGALRDVVDGWIGLDFSLPALRSQPRDAPRLQGDMQQLPVASGAVDAIFSWAALEHVPYPEVVLEEISRVLRPGGVCLLAPAWHVRPWASKALPIRPYSELPPGDRLRKLSIPIREHIAWRALASLLPRVRRELLLASGAVVSFDYVRLTPNLVSYEYTDSDAFTSMYPHAAICYFLSRGWESLTHPSFGQRFVARHEPVLLRKPLSA